jgi:hypothetical protein
MKVKKEKTNFDVQEALEGKGNPRCDKIGVELSGPYSDRFWSETLLTLHHIECGSHDMTLPIHGQSVDAALAPQH